MAYRASILIVDDEVNVARTLQMLLERAGYQVHAAYSCAEALPLLNGNSRFDVVITDLNMEREDIGLEVARAAKSLNHKPLVMVCTGYATVENTQAALDMHIDYLLTKPVDLMELQSALGRLIAMQKLGWKAESA